VLRGLFIRKSGRNGGFGKLGVGALLAQALFLVSARQIGAMPVPFPELRDSERGLISLTNHTRAEFGMGPGLVYDAVLARAALEHSREMASLGYFAHESPVAGNHTLMDRFQKAARQVHAPLPLAYSVGENLYYRESSEPDLDEELLAQEAQRGFMKSTGHRDNLLKRQWHRIGIGAVEGSTIDGGRVWYVTVMFRN
jgi:uncharacterized protein YkwD